MLEQTQNHRSRGPKSAKERAQELASCGHIPSRWKSFRELVEMKEWKEWAIQLYPYCM
jgi:hypothetical protein